MKEEKGKKSVGIIFLWFCSLFRVLCSIFCVFFCFYLTWVIWNLSKKCTHEHSYEHPASFHYDLHVFIVTIFRSFLSRTPRKFQIFCSKKYCCPLRSTGQLSFRTPLHILHFCHSEDHVCIYMSGDRNEHLLREIVKKSWYVMSLSRASLLAAIPLVGRHCNPTQPYLRIGWSRVAGWRRQWHSSFILHPNPHHSLGIFE